MNPKLTILLSGGSYKFHMAPLAAELDKAGQLAAYVTAGWPKGWQLRIAELFSSSTGWKRFLDRKEPISDKLVYSIPLSEMVLKIGDLVFASAPKNQQRVHRLAFLIYSLAAKRVLLKKEPDIYHYRNCYGGRSVYAARQIGIPTLCDHSIAHPIFLHSMEKNSGRWPLADELGQILTALKPLEREMYADLNLADYLLVNSDFVKETCVRAGWDGKDVYVAYLGIDDSFHAALREIRSVTSTRRPTTDILFAGGWQQRKGVETLALALNQVKLPWNLSIVGGMDSSIMSKPAISKLIIKKNVHIHGLLTRRDLAKVMAQHRIFVFPSYCEGSARVVFEALAAGCYVITTPNSGSIVANGVNGRIVDPGDASSLADAIGWAISNPDKVDAIGEYNAKLVAREYLQKDYAKRVAKIYIDVAARGIRSSRERN